MEPDSELFSSQRKDTSLAPLKVGGGVAALVLAALVAFFVTRSTSSYEERIQQEGRRARCEFSDRQIESLRFQSGIEHGRFDDPRFKVERFEGATFARVKGGFLERSVLSCQYRVGDREFNFLMKGRENEALLVDLLSGEHPVVEVAYLPEAPGDARAAAAPARPALAKPLGKERWRPQLDSPHPFEAIGGSSSTDVWFVGAFPNGCRIAEPDCRSVAMHWDGVSLKREPMDVTEIVRGVWAGSPSNAWAAGASLLHWDGTRWTKVPSPSTEAHTGVWGSSQHDVWAVGCAGSLEHWDGGAWSLVPTKTKETLSAVWGTSPGDVWLAGNSILRHWDGKAWTDTTADAPELLALHGTAPDDAWAVGSGSTVLHWDGKAWSRVRLDVEVDGATFLAVHAVSRTNVWVGGDRRVVIHWDGTRWSKVTAPNHQLVRALWGDAEGLWAVTTAPDEGHEDDPLTLFYLAQSPPTDR